MKEFFFAVGLMFVFEGILPFLSPSAWRLVIQKIILRSDLHVRLFGLFSMLLGVIILYLGR